MPLNFWLFFFFWKKVNRLFDMYIYEVRKIAGTGRGGMCQPPDTVLLQGSGIIPIPRLWHVLSWLTGAEGEQRIFSFFDG